MPPITASPAAIAFSAAIAIISVIIGAMLAAWARRDVADRNLRTTVAITLFNEFHAPRFIGYRHTSYEALNAPGADGFVKALAHAGKDQHDALTTLVHFFEKVAVLWEQDKVDRKLITGFIGMYIVNYGAMLFADDGSDTADPLWGDVVTRLQGFTATMTRYTARPG